MPEEILNDFISSLEYVVNAQPQNSRKGIKVTEWFDQYFGSSGKACHVKESKQIANRIVEQFKHKVQHVVFIYDNSVSKDTLYKNIIDKQYPELKTAIMVEFDGHNFTPTVLCKQGDSPEADFFKGFDEIKEVELQEIVQLIPQGVTIDEVIEGKHSTTSTEDKIGFVIVDSFIGQDDTAVVETILEVELGQTVVVLSKDNNYEINSVWEVTSIYNDDSSSSTKLRLKKVNSISTGININTLLGSDVLSQTDLLELKKMMEAYS
ncbi:hypothetical protein [Peribacillus sp. Bi134]|uniref:hypothetical protein n=1 Tax=Peribacillus sp. Bi134 TaxID=2884272 RepID=UPI001D9913F2|nr:hypothetical protein [Peribacillus sp. Bi134]CAH0298550.1 hypothetical protein SRABI134_04564 [Peribacillus sp. Bi134]